MPVHQDALTTEESHTARPAVTIVADDSKRILVVDDEELVRTMASAMLESLGYQVDQAESGAQALNIYEPALHHVVLVDLLMPGMSGEELARALGEQNAHAKIIFTSGMADENMLSQQIPHACILAKPYRRMEMARVIESVLQK